MKTYIIAGLVVGSVYAISALGLVLTYVSSRVFNFAHGAIGLFVAWCFYDFNTRMGWSVAVSAIVSIGLIAPAIGVGLWALLFRHLSKAAPLVRLAATIGLYVVIPPAIILIFGKDPVFSPTGLGGTTAQFELYDVFGTILNLNQVLVIVAAALIAVLMTVLIRYTPYGLAVRAVVDSETVSATFGTNTQLVSAAAWAIGTMLAGLAGVLVLPFLGLDPNGFTLLVIASFAAVVVGRLRSLPFVFAGALAVGLTQEVIVRYLPDTGAWTGVRGSIPFMFILVFLIAFNFIGRESATGDRVVLRSGYAPVSVGSASQWRTFALPALVIGVVLGLPFMLEAFWLGLVAVGIVLGVIFLSYTVIIGEGGMISLAQISFAGIGGIAAAELVGQQGWPVLLAIFVAGLVTVPFGLLIALPALRWAGLYLALGTLAFGLLVDNMIFKIDRFFALGAGMRIGKPAIGSFSFDTGTRFFYLALGVFAILALVVLRLRRSTFGMLLAAIRSSETATATLGFSIVRAKLVVFALSAFVAGLGGALYASYIGRAAPSAYAVPIGLVWLAVVVTLGYRSVLAALVGGISISVLPQLFSYHFSDDWANVPPILFGLGAIALAQEPRGVIVQWAEAGRKLRHRFRPSAPPELEAAGVADAETRAASAAEPEPGSAPREPSASGVSITDTSQ